MLTTNEKKIHEGLRKACSQLKSSTEAIVVTLIEVARLKYYRKLGRRNLVQYIIDDLEIDSTFTFDLNRVVRASLEFPVLERALRKGEISVGKATRILSVLKPENAKELIAYASKHTFAEINGFVAEKSEAVNRRETFKQLSADQYKITVVLSGRQYKDLRRAQSIEAQKQKQAKMGDAIGAALITHLWKHDPVQKAARAKRRAQTSESKIVKADSSSVEHGLVAVTNIDVQPNDATNMAGPIHSDVSVSDASRTSAQQVAEPRLDSSKRSPNLASAVDQQSQSITVKRWSDLQAVEDVVRTMPKRFERIRLTAAEVHAVYDMLGGRCAFVDDRNRRCTEDRWIEIHHIKQVSEGGTNHISNLTLLCGCHHDLVHQTHFPLEGQVTWELARSRYS